MESMNVILKSKKSSEPPQVSALKAYAKKHHDTDITVRVSASHYLISAPSAAVAQKLRFETLQIKQECNLDKRLVIHIGYA
jgi:hypothetical protein